MDTITTARDTVTGAYANTFDVSASGPVATSGIVIDASGDLGGDYQDSTGVYVFTQPVGGAGPQAVRVTSADGDAKVVGIDSTGAIYGTYGVFDPKTQSTTTYSFKDGGGTLTTLAGPLGAAGTTLLSVRSDGVATGTYTDAAGKPQAFVLSDGTATPIKVVSGGQAVSDSFPTYTSYGSSPPVTPVDAAGDVAGVYFGTDGQYHAFLANLSNPGAGTTLNVPAQSSQAYIAVTAVRGGAVVGRSGASPSAAFYATAGSTKTIPAPDGASSARPIGFDAAGNVVGTYGNGFGPGQSFTYNPVLGTSTPFVYAGAPPAGATVQSTVVTSTDATGDVFGTYRDSNGVDHGFVDQGGVFRTVPGPAGTIAVTPAGVDAAGDAVGAFSTYGYSGSIVDRGGASTPVTLPGSPQPGGFYADLYVDPLGQIVGTVQDGTGTHGFVVGPGPASTFDGAPDATDTVPVGSDAAGDVAGYLYDANGRERGFVRTAGGVVTTFDGSSTATNTFVVGIDAVGEVFGGYDEGGNRHAYLRAPDGTITRLDPAGSTSTAVTFSDAAGDAAGYYETENGGTTTDAGIFTRIGGKLTATSLTGLGAASFDDEVSLDAAGDVYGEFDPASGAQQAFFIPAGGAAVRIAPADAQYSQIQDVNGSGTVVGDYRDAGGTDHGFVYAKGQFTPIDVPNGTTPAPVTGIDVNTVDAAGDVGGVYYSGGSSRAFVRTAGGTFSTIALPSDAKADGKSDIFGITASGVVAGYYDGSDGDRHLFIAQSGSTAATRLDPQTSQQGSYFVSGSFSPSGTDAGPANGVIAANYVDANGQGHGLVYLGGQVTVVTGSATATDTTIDSVDAQGDIVGTYTDSAGSHTFVSFVARTPTISGTHASSTTGEAALAPFSGVMVGDSNAGASEKLTIAFSGAGGTLSDGAGYAGLRLNSDGSYALTGTAAAVTAELDALSFKPAAAGSTTFTLRDVTSIGGVFTDTATDAATVVTDTAAPTPTPTPAAPDAVSFNNQVYYDQGFLVVSGRAASAAGVSKVEITARVDGVATDLGTATVNADGSFSFRDCVGARTQGFVTATETDKAGGMASAVADFSLQGGIGGGYKAEQDRYNADGSVVIATNLYKESGTQNATLNTGGLTFFSDIKDVFENGGQPGSTFVFGTGYGDDVVDLFRPDNVDHDTLSFLGSSFNNDIADVLGHITQNKNGDAVIHDPGTKGDSVTLIGVSRQQFAINAQQDVTFHA